MAVYYALPALTNWDSPTNAFSLSSGGAALTVTPSTTDDVIFDSNSGGARTITGTNMVCRHLTFNTGVNAITLSVSNLFSTYGNVTLRSNIVIIGLWYIYTSGHVNNLVQITANGAILQANIGNINSGAGITVEFTDNFVTNGAVTQSTAGTISFLGTYYAFGRVNFTSTGTVVFAANQIFEITGTVNNIWACSSGTTLSIPASHTIKFTGNLTATANTTFQSSKLYANVWFDNGGTLTNHLIINGLNCTSLRVFPGAYLKVATGTSLVATYWQVEGLKSKGIVFVASGGTAILYNNQMSVPVTVQHTYFESGYTVTYGPMKSIYTPPGSTTPTGMTLLQTVPNFGSFF